MAYDRSPLINDEEIDIRERIEPQYIFEGQSTLGGLACADIWERLLLVLLQLKNGKSFN